MKKTYSLIVFFLLSFFFQAYAGLIVIDGSYQGKNLFIQNPFAGSGVGFCTTEVLVNDITSTDEIQSSAYEIDLTNFRLKLGDKITVKIRHKDDCKPKILNPEVLKPSSTFELISFNADANNLKWTTKGENGSLSFVVEQFRWNKWVKAAEVSGKGTPDANEYSVKVKHHSGINKYRLSQTDYTGRPRQTPPIQYRNSEPEVTFGPPKVTRDITFSAETMFEIFNEYGELVKKGYGSSVDVGALPKGIYYLNFDNKQDKFIKK